MCVPEDEVVYSPEVNDAELEKILGKAGHKIAEAIKDSIGGTAPVPKGLTTTQTVLAIAGSVILIAATLVGAMKYIVTSSITLAISAAMEQPNKDLATLKEQGTGLRRDVDRLLDRIARATLQSPTAGALAKDTASQIKDAAKWAIQRRIEIEPNAIRKVSESLAQNHDPDSWEAVGSLLNLRSFVNATSEFAKQHVVATIRQRKGTTEIPERSRGEYVELENLVVKLDGVPGEHDVLTLPDGSPMKVVENLIIKDSMVEYRGGKVTLINVFFEELYI